MERVDRRQALDEHIADAEAHRGEPRQREPDHSQILTDGGGDEGEPREGHGRPRPLTGGRPLTQHHRGEDDGEERLGLDHDRGEAGRHTQGDAEELQEELAGEEEETGHDEGAPGYGRPGQPQGGDGRDEKAEEGELGRRHHVEGDPGRHEREAPDHRHEQRQDHVDA